MTKDVLVMIKGLHFAGPVDDDEDKVEVIVAGKYYKKNGVKYIIYDEHFDAIAGKVRSTIMIYPDRVEMTKNGPVAVSMVFEEGQKNLSSYRTPFGNLVMGVDTSSIGIKEEEDKMQIEIKYHLDMNYQHVADCSVNIVVTSKENGSVLFQ